MTKHGLLPPPPVPPRRTQSGSGMRAVDSEAKTPSRNNTAASFAALASVFDEMTPTQRVAFIDLAFTYKSLDDAKRQRLLDLALEWLGL